MPITFISLPAEVRGRIYHYYFRDTNIILNIDPDISIDSEAQEWLPAEQDRIQPRPRAASYVFALPRVCHLIWQETRHLIDYSNSSFVWYTDNPEMEMGRSEELDLTDSILASNGMTSLMSKVKAILIPREFAVGLDKHEEIDGKLQCDWPYPSKVVCYNTKAELEEYLDY